MKKITKVTPKKAPCPTVKGNGNDLIPASARFKRGGKAEIKVPVAAARAPDPVAAIDWLGWEI
jgi:hypothetical protein